MAIDRDLEGRICCVEIDFEAVSTFLVCVYAPAVNSQQQKVLFLSNLHKMIGSNCTNAIVGEDFNIQLDEDKDKGPRRRGEASRSSLRCMLATLRLTDIWRLQHPQLQKYTWRRPDLAQQSRIDYIFVSDSLVNNHLVKTSDIAPGVLSDHSVVSVEIQLGGQYSRSRPVSF